MGRSFVQTAVIVKAFVRATFVISARRGGPYGVRSALAFEQAMEPRLVLPFLPGSAKSG